MEKYLQIGKENLKHNMPLPAAVCVILLVLSPLIVGVKNLELTDTAKILEMFAALLGIILIPPVFLPEQNKDLRDLIYSKYTKASHIYLVRILEAVILLAVLLAVYMGMLKAFHCDMKPLAYFGGTMAEILFFGGLGIFCYGLFDNLVAGYMIPLFYYVAAVGSGSKYLKMFYPFSMSAGSYREKYYLLAGAVLLLAAGTALRCRRK